jgi:hypothetical protein
MSKVIVTVIMFVMSAQAMAWTGYMPFYGEELKPATVFIGKGNTVKAGRIITAEITYNDGPSTGKTVIVPNIRVKSLMPKPCEGKMYVNIEFLHNPYWNENLPDFVMPIETKSGISCWFK